MTDDEDGETQLGCGAMIAPLEPVALGSAKPLEPAL